MHMSIYKKQFQLKAKADPPMTCNNVKLPLVSVGIPTYNRPEGLRRTLECITRQTYSNLEIIVSDNDSPDRETEVVVREFMAKDSRIKYYRQEENKGITFNFKFVLELATGEYFMWAADDDVWKLSFISCLVEALEINSDAVLAFCRHDIYHENRHTGHIESTKDNWSEITTLSLYNRLFYTYSSLSRISSIRCVYIYGLMRRDILLKSGGVNWYIEIGGDIIMLYRLLCHGKFVLIDKLLFHSGQRDSLLGSPSQRLTKRSMNYIHYLITWHRHYHILRRTVQKTSLNCIQKCVLITMLCLTEIIFYINSLVRTASFYIR